MRELAPVLALMVLATAPNAEEVVGAPGDVVEGGGIFAAYCATCHGDGARGDGRMGAVLTILPPDLTSLAAGNGGVFPVSQVVRQIDGRDPLLAHGGVMPLFGDFFEGEDVAIASETG
ncbi:MAG: c-type cytochrome [Pseudomonadota bacterium]